MEVTRKKHSVIGIVSLLAGSLLILGLTASVVFAAYGDGLYGASTYDGSSSSTYAFFADFESGTYTIDGSAVTVNDLNIANGNPRNWFDNGLLTTGATNTAGFVDNALLLRGEAFQIITEPTDPSAWRDSGGITVAASSSKTYGSLTGYTLTSPGNNDAVRRPDDAFLIQPSAGDTYMMSVIYELGSSGSIEIIIRDADAGLNSKLLLQVPGAPLATQSAAGVISDYFDEALSGDVRLLTLLFTATTTSSNYAFGIGPDGASGEDVIVYGANVWSGETIHDFNTYHGTRTAETISPDLATSTYDFFVVGGDGKEELRTSVSWTPGDTITPPHDSQSIKTIYAWGDGESTVQAPPNPGYDVYVLAGQSNMAGRFGPADFENEEIPDRSIFYIPGESNTASGLGGSVVGGRIYPAIDPLVHYSISGNSLHVGPGTAFARTIRKATHPNRDILLLATAEGGTGIVSDSDEWNPNGTTGDGGVRYNSMIADITAALALDVDNELKAVYWSQGETNAGAGAQTTYPPAFLAFATSTRTAVGDTDLPFVLSGLLPENSSYDIMNAAQASMDQDSGESDAISRVRYVAGPIGYSGGDNIHFSVAGQRLRGVDAAEALIDSGWITYSTSTNVSGSSAASSDTTAPTVSMTAPSDSTTVSGDTTVSASASDDTAVVGVQFKLDGAALGSEDTSAPYSITWDTTGVSDASYDLVAVARDAADNYATSSAVTVTVNNTSTSSPSVTTTAASSISSTTATLGGDITDDGGASSTVRGVVYADDAALTTNAATTTENGTFGNGTFSTSISSLTCESTYYFRAYATNPEGIGYGSVLSFTTDACAASSSNPTVTTSAASSIDQTSATLNGTIVSNNNATTTTRGFVYAENAALTTNAVTTTENGTYDTGSFTTDLSSLSCGSTYYFRAYATNSEGTGYGAVTSLTTDACDVLVSIPTVTTSAASSIERTSATLNGTITATGGDDSSERGFVYADDAALTTNAATTTENGTFGNGTFSTSISSLTCNTDYYFRAFATNASGTGYGSVVSLTTSACASSGGGGGGGSSKDDLEIDDITVSGTTATVDGTINDEDDWTLYLVVSKTDRTPSCTDDKMTRYDLSGTYNEDDDFSYTLSALAPNAKFYTRLCGEQKGEYEDKGDVTSFTTGNASEDMQDDIGGAGSGDSSNATTLRERLTAQLSTLRAQVAVLLQRLGLAQENITTSPSPTTATSIKLTRDLYLGVSGSDVSDLQQFLKQKGHYTYPEITGYYGAATKAAVTKFQNANGIPALGGVGPTTRAKINSMSSGLPSTPTTQPTIPQPSASLAPSIPTTATSIKLTRDLYFDLSGADVSDLQRFLKERGYYTYPEITGYFGGATKAAVQAFQKANGIPALGGVGPQTRAVINAQ